MFKRAIAPEPDSISLCKPFGQFDEHAPIRRILDFSKGNDQPQILNHAQIDLIIPKYLQQFITGIIGIVGAHSKSSRGEQQTATRGVSRQFRSTLTTRPFSVASASPAWYSVI